MAKIPRIQFKRTKTPGTKPSKDILAEGELAINLADRTLFTKSGDDIIDLGFAKGGTVNGDINQEAGNFTTNGSMTAKTYIDIKNSLNDKKIFRLSYEGDRGALLSVNEGDNKWKTILVPLDEDGTKTIATREHVGKMVSTNDGETKLRAPNQTNLLIAKDNKELVWYDGSTNNRMVNFGAGGLDLAHKGSDIVGVSLYKKDGNQVRIETHAHSSSLMLAFAYKDSAGNNSYVINMPKENGVLASQQWVDGKYYKRNDSPSFKEYVNVFHNTTGSYTQLGYGNAGATWSVNTGGNWYILKHPLANGTVASQEWTNKIVNHNGQQVELISPNGTMKATLQNNGTFSTWNGNGNPISVDVVGNTSVTGTIQAVSSVTARTANSNTIFGLFVRDKEAFLSLNIDNKWVGELHHPKTSGTIATQQWSNGQHYAKSETYNKSEIDGKVNGRLTQAQGDARYALSNLYQSEGGESRVWNGSKTYYLFTNNNANSGLYKHGTGYIWGFNASGQMTAGLIPIGCGGTGAKDAGTARANLSIYSKAETDGRYPLKNDVYAKSSTYSRAEVDSRVNGRLTQATADGRYAYKGGANAQNFGANIVDAADVNIRSDLTVKSNLVKINNAIQTVKSLTGYTYDLKLNDNTYKQSAGIIAQDVQKVLPALVTEDSLGLLSVNYNGLTAVLVNAINELSERLERLERGV
ncbi:long tail fiber protein distal subunit [Proteus phage phiP4-3]|uniref:Long tail fiber protein Gp37 n=1 Tax=Proteus phage phiP4-3 TaxID=2065203 RepID=A0A2I6PF75_9CAUD|nr:long tail fiber protein distal subunit [Proteus phage phiP4-3]AUM58374.1 long tail fiber distal subunit [Proteus phage phiP4-3]